MYSVLPERPDPVDLYKIPARAGIFFWSNMKYNIIKGMIDSHFHCSEMARKGLDVKEILTTLQNKGMELLLDAGVKLDDFNDRLLYRENHRGLYFAAGIHPNIPSAEWPAEYEKKLGEQAAHPFVKAVGETGLDFFREYSTKDDQYGLLDLHYRISIEVEKPLIFHCRDAENELSQWLKERDFPFGAVLHCFPGDSALGKAAIEKGFMISLAGNSTFKNAGSLRKALEWIPEDKLLVETDSPYLSPHPLRGKPNHPGHIGYVYEMIRDEWNIPMDDLIARVNKNFKNFIGL